MFLISKRSVIYECLAQFYSLQDTSNKAIQRKSGVFNIPNKYLSEFFKKRIGKERID